MSQTMDQLTWAFPVSPAYAWFESFVNQISSPDLVFIVDIEDDKPNAYALSSPHFNELTTATDVIERAVSLKAVLDGAFFLNYGKDFSPFKLQVLVHLDDHSRYGIRGNEYEIITSPFCADSASWISTWRKPRTPFNTFEASMLFLAREDESSRGLLQFLGLNGCTWISLYALLDFLKTGGLSVKEIAVLANTSEAEIKHFTHTANNFSAIGPLCRHGDLGQKPPNNPMRLTAAAAILLPATRKYLLQRINDLGLQKRWGENTI